MDISLGAKLPDLFPNPSTVSKSPKENRRTLKVLRLCEPQR